jgi:hypothetical protein
VVCGPAVSVPGCGHREERRPHCLSGGRRPDRRRDRVTKRAQCALRNGLGVGTRGSDAEAGQRRTALSRRTPRGCPVLLLLELRLGARTLSPGPALACRCSCS